MTDIGKLCSKLYGRIEWQRLPSTLNTIDREKMLVSAVVYGIEDLYSYTYENEIESEFSYDLGLDEELYVLCSAQKYFFDKVRAQYTDLLGYTTNALTVTNADKPYTYITGTIKELDEKMRIYFYKMVQYSHLD